ncbi:response regulator [Kribbella jejuensis]|uniref:response regulator n=1 Tax=Kribbella jejuensis TaxID=236068 RepID=UPI003CD06223
MAKVAVCEDDRALRGVLRRALESDGHSVAASATGVELLAQLDPAPNVVILDIGLPDAGGRDVLPGAARARGGRPGPDADRPG